MRRTTALTIFAATTMLALAGCTASASANLTVPSTDVADLAATALEEQFGTRPDVDCGDDQVDLVDDTVVDCVLSDGTSDVSYDTAVTISGVDGTKYSVDVQVAEEPRAGSSDATTETPAAAAPSDGYVLSVPANNIATLAYNALAEQSPPGYFVECGEGNLEVRLNAVFECTASDNQKTAYDAAITVTEVTATSYKIDVKVAADPRS